MSSCSNFVIGSDDESIELIEDNLDYKQAYDNIPEQNATVSHTTSANKKKQLQNTFQTSYQSVRQLSSHACDAEEFMYETEYKPISDIIDTSQYYPFQKLLHKIVHPLVWLCDTPLVRRRSWLQIPFIKYMTRITSMIIGITLSQLIIKAYELKASNNDVQNGYDLHDVIYFLSAYVVLISVLCICFLYSYYHYYYDTLSPYHYNYFVMTCCGIIGYGILYLLIHIQSEFYSSSIHDTIRCLAASFMFAISFIGVVIFIKQFVFDFSFKYNTIEDEYDSDEDNDHNPLLNDDDDDDDDEFIIDKHIDDDDVMLNEYKEKGVLWFTISCISLDIWHISIGLLMIECVVYILSGSYINLLIDWTHDESTAIRNIWNIVVFGLLLAFITGVVQIALQIYCKSPLYQYQLELSAMNGYHNYTAMNGSTHNNVIVSYLSTLPHKEDIILFLLNWINDMSLLWNKILSAAIGWSLLTPNQTNSIITQFVTAMTATFLFLFIGYIFSDYKRRIQKDILSEIRDIKKQLRCNDNNIDDDGTLMRMIVYDKQKLVFYDQLHATYDLAFAVSVSYSWESFIVIALSDVFGSNPLNRFIAHLFLAVFVGLVFAQLGLELVDVKRQRLKEAKMRKNRNKNQVQNSPNKDVKLQISSKTSP